MPGHVLARAAQRRAAPVARAARRVRGRGEGRRAAAAAGVRAAGQRPVELPGREPVPVPAELCAAEERLARRARGRAPRSGLRSRLLSEKDPNTTGVSLIYQNDW